MLTAYAFLQECARICAFLWAEVETDAVRWSLHIAFICRSHDCITHLVQLNTYQCFVNSFQIALPFKNLNIYIMYWKHCFLKKTGPISVEWAMGCYPIPSLCTITQDINFITIVCIRSKAFKCSFSWSTWVEGLHNWNISSINGLLLIPIFNDDSHDGHSLWILIESRVSPSSILLILSTSPIATPGRKSGSCL